MEDTRSNRHIWQLVMLIMILGITAVLFILFVDVAAVYRELRHAQPVYMLVASLLLLAGLSCFALRWRFLLQNRPGFWHTFHAANIGHAGNMLLPGRVGEPARIVVMGQDGSVSYTEATSSFVVERLFEQMMRLLALATAVTLGAGLTITPRAIGSGLLFLAIAFSLIFWLVRNRQWTMQWGTAVLSKLPRVTPEKAAHWLGDLLDNLQYVSSLPHTVQTIGWSLLSWLFFGGFFYLVLLALGDRITAAERLPIAIGALALSPPSAATQPGLFHGSVVIPLTAVGYDRNILTAYAILLHIIEMFWIILLAIVGLWQTGISVTAVMRRP
ncbi:MAG TPA: lysylphosphatidylglycerol synthase transmembrane domain-containing protein [Chloroflexota bacterium]|nr:lysylphosphatidylglycerol synthase transmembrane domain-containing protein [Chloroflexota bacterium]HUM67815.1 lysylphosphatidylglycerol synthase transmembrane domain-containing protein [Chloroflexota bacterium]